jgi:hypothetical protein
MENDELIPAEQFCVYHNIEYSFIRLLYDSGLISITFVDHSSFIPADEIQKLEKFIRLHYDLDINLEGIETIQHLLKKMEKLQQEILHLKNSSTI